MNEQLKFSWGHIIAFLALIFISYISFVGVTYLTDGNFTTAGIAMAVIDVVLFVFFIGAQMMKATEKKFAKRIWVERVFIFGSPVVFLIAMFPYFHFWTVNSQDEEIVNNFTNAIEASKQMFNDYADYSNSRIENYDKMLNRVVSNERLHPDQYAQCGFTKGNGAIEKENMVKTLRLQLLSENYDSLRNVAYEWIESSSKGASTINVFLLGNTKEIKTAIHEWNNILVGFASNKLSNEEFHGYNTVSSFADRSSSLSSVDAGLNGLTEKFTTTHFPTLIALLTALLLYASLLFPYLLQDRHTKNQHRLMGMEKGAMRGGGFTIPMDKPTPKKETKKEKKKEKPNRIIFASYDDEKEVKVPSQPSKSNDDEEDEYASFTM